MRRHARRFHLFAIVIGFAMSVAGGVALADSHDAAVGSWALNVAKSKYDPGPPPKSMTLKIERAGDGVKVTAVSVSADGVSTQTEYTATYDGKDHPLKGVEDADTVSVKRIDSNTIERTDKKAGKVLRTYTRKLSADGKTLTATIKGTDAKGRTIHDQAVFERQ